MFWAHVLIVMWANCIIQHLVSLHSCRCDGTRDCIIQFCPPDDLRKCLKHVEAWNKLIIKFSASSCLILINKYIEMRGQQNIKNKIGSKYLGFVQCSNKGIMKLDIQALMLACYIVNRGKLAISQISTLHLFRFGLAAN